MTYVAGCTDPSFTSSKCVPKFNYPGQQYVSLARCDGKQLDIWAGCGKHDDWISIQPEPACTCDPNSVILRNARQQSTLDDIASLPLTAGGTISFNPTALPTRFQDGEGDGTASPTVRGTFGTSSSGAGAPTGAAPRYTASPNSNEMSTTTKVAIGVAVPVFAILVAAVIFLVIQLRRRKAATATAATAESNHQPIPNPDHHPPTSSIVQDKPSTLSPPPSFSTALADPYHDQAGSPHSPHYSGYKAELAAPLREAGIKQHLAEPLHPGYNTSGSHADLLHGAPSPGAPSETSGFQRGGTDDGLGYGGISPGPIDGGLSPSPPSHGPFSTSVNGVHHGIGGPANQVGPSSELRDSTVGQDQAIGNGHDERVQRYSELQG